ncbi:rab-GTPase-TBC domain-containing protein [Mucor mucedo]|uniref:rab-GTPase-TBC domain-containing protein n=1 Tax=Mucor mucedo TaxID=29922 RepID=UPI00221ED94B|nr:rab-GTPase-TBC domain-containing protein [Mucor mucedo]KAI7892105.1 rab-GTPase-TBC domain-containing protein [Mucor mucedo]
MLLKEQNGLHQAFQFLFSRKTKTTPEISPFTSRSNSNITINSLLSPTPTPSTSITYSEKEEPWRLLDDGHIHHDYFFMDRQDLYTMNDIIERDSYGFKRPTQWVQIKHLHQFDTYYQPILDKQQLNWNSMLNQCQGVYPPANSITLRTNVRKGIPSQYRGMAWMHYSGAKSKMDDNPELYESLVNTAISMGDHNEFAEIIQRDLHRTFPDNSKFACGYFTQRDGSISMEPPETNTKLSALRRILLAFSIHSPQIGYCQSLNYLAGFFLLFVEKEEEAFWMMVATVHDYMPENMYDVTMEGANIDQSVLMLLLQERLPKDVWAKINNNENGSPPITLVTSHWFLTMFINILPVETVLRIWDCFFM